MHSESWAQSPTPQNSYFILWLQVSTGRYSPTSLCHYLEWNSTVISEPPPFGGRWLKKQWLELCFSLQQLKKCPRVSSSVTYEDISCRHGPKVSHAPDYWQQCCQGKLCLRTYVRLKDQTGAWQPLHLLLPEELQKSHRSSQGNVRKCKF